MNEYHKIIGSIRKFDDSFLYTRQEPNTFLFKREPDVTPIFFIVKENCVTEVEIEVCGFMDSKVKGERYTFQ